MQCWVYASGWFIYVLVLAFATVPQHRYSEDPIVHSGEMRLLDLPTSNPYAYSTSEFSDNLGLVDWYQLSTEPPLLTPTNAAAQNLSARVVVPQIRDTYGRDITPPLFLFVLSLIVCVLCCVVYNYESQASRSSMTGGIRTRG